MYGNASRLLTAVMVPLFLSAFAIGTAFASGGLQQTQPKELRFVAANHPFTDVIKTLIPEYEKQTAVKVNLKSYEENQLTQKLTVEFASGGSSIDVFMTRPLPRRQLVKSTDGDLDRRWLEIL